MDWIKIMCNILDNRKIKMIRKGPEGDTIVLLWILMLIEGGKCNRGGYLMISDNRPYSPETISMVTDISLPTVQLGLTIFLELEMIDRRDGAIFIRNWWKYQSEDKLAARRKNDRLRQQRHRALERSKIQTLPLSDSVSRDSHVCTSRDVTQENRQEKNRLEKTTTGKIRLLLSDTPLEKISDRVLEGLAFRHGRERLLEAADIASETWRRTPVEMHNPGGYLQSLCTALIVPEWYVPPSERTISPPPDIKTEADQWEPDELEEAENTARDALWTSLTDEQREGYLAAINVNKPRGVTFNQNVLLLLAKGRAWDDSRSGNDG